MIAESRSTQQDLQDKIWVQELGNSKGFLWLNLRSGWSTSERSQDKIWKIIRQDFMSKVGEVKERSDVASYHRVNQAGQTLFFSQKLFQENSLLSFACTSLYLRTITLSFQKISYESAIEAQTWNVHVSLSVWPALVLVTINATRHLACDPQRVKWTDTQAWKVKTFRFSHITRGPADF